MKRVSPQIAAFVLAGTVLTLPLLAFADDSFVSLTQFPGLAVIGNSPTIPGFLNNLYKIAIGLAAIFAVVEIIWAGFLFATSSDNVSQNTKARKKITNAILGLIIVLSPYVVFSVINPKILNLDLNFGSLQTKNGTGAPANPNNNPTQAGSPNSASECSPACGAGQVCSNNQCISAAQNEQTCSAYTTIEIRSKANTCPGNEVKIPDTCCTLQQGYQCCGSK